ncbi:MAG: sugar dehydrogenase complex small subunit [Caldilineaceae bacterium]
MPEDAPTQGEQPAANIPEWDESPPSGFTLSRRTLLIGGGVLVVGGLLTGFSLNQQQQGYRGLGQAGTASTLENFTHFSALVTGFDVSELDAQTAQALYTAYEQTPPVGASPEAASAATGGTSAANAASGDVTSTVTSTLATTATAAVTATAVTTGATAGTASGTPVATLVAASAPSVPSATLEDLLRKAGYLSRNPPQTLSEIERRGVFADEPYASMANGIIEGWYSGLVQTPGGTSQTVAWLHALGWQGLGYTMAPAYCEGETGIWGSAPGEAPAAAPAAATTTA